MKYRVYETELVEAIHEFDTVWTYRLKLVEGKEMPEFLPGHYAHVAAPGLTEITKPLLRHLSIDPIPEDGEFIFSMEVGSGSQFKRMFLDAKPGAIIKLFKAQGGIHP